MSHEDRHQIRNALLVLRGLVGIAMVCSVGLAAIWEIRGLVIGAALFFPGLALIAQAEREFRSR